MSEWQPIETAPKDSRVLLYSPTLFCGYAHPGTWDRDQYAKKPRPFWNFDWIDRTNSRSNPPTHWMPIPAPPNSGH